MMATKSIPSSATAEEGATVGRGWGLLLLLLLCVTAGQARDAENCVVCHSVPLLMRATGQDSLRIYEVDIRTYLMTSHARIACSDCHEDITGYPHPESVAKVDCGKTCHINKPYTLTSFSHREQVEMLARSVHGVKPGEDPALSRQKPTCTYCHGNRIYEKDPDLLIQRANRCSICHLEGGLQEMLVHIDRLGELHNAQTSQDIVRVCSSCHAKESLMKQLEINPSQVEGFESHFHGKAMKLGLDRAAHCSDCHTSHLVLPADNPASSVSGANITRTCGACHKDATQEFAKAAVHSVPTRSDSPIIYFVELGFYVLTGATMAFLFTHIMLDLLRWAVDALPRRRRQGATVHREPAALDEEGLPVAPRVFQRFTRGQRLQHIFMLVPFIVLVMTGFPLKFPSSAFWAFTLEQLGGVERLRLVHRAAAAVMIIDFAGHVALLAWWALRRRPGLKGMTLLPDLKDLRDLWQNLRYFTFASNERPRFGRFSYIEKFDYWAVFWGMFIMAGSGLVLWHPVGASRVLSGELIRIASIAHSDEALLAFLAITCWHFYNVHFNPRVWPANTVWLKGTLTEEEMRHEHPLELERILAEEAERRHAVAGRRDRRAGDRRHGEDDRRHLEETRGGRP
jgi:cytochrome b subunit of formate dehydrogenase